jgi:uncharacterized membrane protein YeaQ/YmgE (transglycosylase-associated protein family)
VLWLIGVIVVSGFVTGGLARLILPGPDPMSWWMTLLLGWAGSIVGGFVAWILFGRAAGIILSVLGAVLLLGAYRMFVERRPLTSSR